jgi:N-methylhydantoinase B
MTRKTSEPDLSAPAPVSPVQLEIFKNRFASIAEEMGVTLTRTAFSPNIKERRDLSCALFDARGDMVAQAAHIPVHLGSMPLSVRAAIMELDLGPGDMTMLNDPYRGGTHLPDITLIAPVFAPGESRPAFFAANRAHHADVGGMSGGSMPLSSSLFQEGLIIPPVKIMERGEIVEPILRLVLANVRTPAERRGDFEAQIMANRVGTRRLGELLAAHPGRAPGGLRGPDHGQPGRNAPPRRTPRCARRSQTDPARKRSGRLFRDVASRSH